ncbi:MAG: hypothetical protein BWY66_02139 [bacterium ADurb.Bin374]|nr:MAG: hypothetical protein BWY66_02139 [bacterium ADurb.Bin374]
MPVAGFEGRSMSIATGFLSISRDSSAIGAGIVAEKNRVWRGVAGRCRNTRRMSGRKPMSSMRSASSRTRTLMSASFA